MEMQKVKINGANVAYARRGNGAPLVLIHGYPLDHSVWDPLAPFLEHDFDLIIPDLRGFGESDAMPADRSMLDYAADIAGLLTELKVAKAIIAGHSMGGYVTLAFARAYGDRMTGLAMVSSQTGADTPERKEGRLATAKQLMQDGAGREAEAMAPKLSAQKQWQEFARELIARQSPEGMASALQAMAARPDSAELFAALPFPVVIVHGDADALIPVQKGRDMKAALPAAHYEELRGAGHLPMMEQPEQVAEALRFFHA